MQTLDLLLWLMEYNRFISKGRDAYRGELPPYFLYIDQSYTVSHKAVFLDGTVIIGGEKILRHCDDRRADLVAMTPQTEVL